MMNLLELTRTIGTIRQLAILMTEGDEGAAARWTALQTWLDQNPQYRSILESSLPMTPPQAVDYLCEQLGLDAKLLAQFDPQRALRSSAEGTIAKIQTLYQQAKEHYAEKV